MREAGHVVTNSLRGTAHEEPPEHVRFDVAGPCPRIDTFRLVDDQPWSLTSTWCHPELLGDIADRWPGEGSLSTVLQQHYGLTVIRDTRAFAAIPADGQASEYLGTAVGDPVLRVRGHNVDEATGRVLVAVEHLFAGEAIEFAVRMRP